MTARFVYLARHGMADAFGEPTDDGRRQSDLLGRRLSELPIDAVWHSPLPRAAASAHELARHLPNVPVAEAAELIDHVPYVPPASETPQSWSGFLDGYDPREAAAGRGLADALTARFAGPPDLRQGALSGASEQTHEVLVTHAYPIAWLVRDALGAAPARWLSLVGSANTGLTAIEYRPGLPPTLVLFNDSSHLPAELRWTGFPSGARP